MAIVNSADGVIALDSQKMENKLSALFAADSLCEKYGAKMVPYAEKLFDILLDSIQCKYSLELRSEAIKMSQRYMDVMMEGVKQNLCSPQQLNLLCDKLLNGLISVLNEGRAQKTEGKQKKGDTQKTEDSACIGVAAKGLLEFINKV